MAQKKNTWLLFAAFVIIMPSCRLSKNSDIFISDYDRSCEYVFMNDTDIECSVVWYHWTAQGEASESITIKPGNLFSEVGWYRYTFLYSAERISFSFSDRPIYLVENPEHTPGIGRNWWDTLPKTTYSLLSDKPIKEVRKFYLSDVWNIIELELLQ